MRDWKLRMYPPVTLGDVERKLEGYGVKPRSESKQKAIGMQLAIFGAFSEWGGRIEDHGRGIRKLATIGTVGLSMIDADIAALDRDLRSLKSIVRNFREMIEQERK